MRRKTHLLGLLAPCALIAAACQSISGLDADYRLASEGTQGDSSSGGASGGTSGTGGDATADVATDNDGRTATDASADSGTLDCSNPPGAGVLWCDTFEGASSAPFFGWTRRENSGGDPVVEVNVGRNNTRGLRATTVSGGGSVATVLWKNAASNFPDNKTVTFTFWFKVKTVAIDYAVIAAIQFDGAEYGLAVYKNPSCPGGQVCLDENDSAGGHSFSNARGITPGDRWYRGEIRLTRGGSSYMGSVLVEGVPVDSNRPNAITGAEPSAPGNWMEVGAGAFFSGTNGGTTETLVDDVLVRRD